MKLDGIQNLRAIAAIAVVFDHCAAMSAFEKYYGVKSSLHDALLSGSLGVNLFFMISGFIIVISAFKAGTNGSVVMKKRLVDFLTARFVRIAPMMWLAISSYALLRLVGRGEFNAMPYLNAALLLPFGDYDPNNIWTLRHELIFYAVFGLCFLRPRRNITLFVAWCVTPFFVLALPGENILIESLKNIFSPLNILFGAGAMIGLIYLRRPDWLEHAGRVVPRVAKSPIGLILLFYATTVSAPHLALKDPTLILYTLPAFAFILIAATQAANGASPLITYLGNASFSIYLFHPHFESALLGVFSRLLPRVEVGFVILVVSTIALASSCAIYSLIEKRLTRMLTGFMGHSSLPRSDPRE